MKGGIGRDEDRKRRAKGRREVGGGKERKKRK